MRQGAEEGTRPNIGRRPNPTASEDVLTNVNNATGDSVGMSQSADHETSTAVSHSSVPQPAQGGKFKRDKRRDSSTKDSSPENNAKGPLITKQMFDKWTPDLLGITPSNRSVRSTRNPAPRYVDATAAA